MFERLTHALSQAIVRALSAFIVAGTLAAAYGAGLVWLAVRSGSMQAIWLLVASLGVLAGLASAGLVLVWRLAPAIAALRGLEYLADRAPEQVVDTPVLAQPTAVGRVTREQAADLAHAA